MFNMTLFLFFYFSLFGFNVFLPIPISFKPFCSFRHCKSYYEHKLRRLIGIFWPFQEQQLLEVVCQSSFWCERTRHVLRCLNVQLSKLVRLMTGKAVKQMDIKEVHVSWQWGCYVTWDGQESSLRFFTRCLLSNCMQKKLLRAEYIIPCLVGDTLLYRSWTVVGIHICA